MQRWEISAVQAGALLAGVVSLSGHALAVSHFVRVGGRDAWLSGLVALPAALVAMWALARLARWFPGQTLVEYTPHILGYPGYLLAALYPLYYFTVVLFTLRMTTDWLVDTILMETPTWVTGTLYMAAVLYIANGGLDVLARANQFLLPLLTLLGFLVSFGTLQAKDYRVLLPMLENGPGPVLAASVLAMGHYGEGAIAGVLGAYVPGKEQKRLSRAYLWALLFLAMTFTGPLAGAMATLGYRVAANMPFPTFQHWLMVSFARFFERTDLLAVHQWLAGAYVRTGLYLLAAVHGFCQLTRKPKLSPNLLAGAGAAAVLASELLFRTKPAFDTFVVNVYLPASAIAGIAIPPVLLAVAWLRGLHKQGQATRTYGG